MQKRVSILIIGRNTGEDLPRLFNSIKKLTYPKKYLEVIYVDDASSDNSIKIAKEFGAKTYRFKKRQGRAKVRNFALQKSKYPIIAWIDADCEIRDKNWIQNMLRHLKGKIIGVSGDQLKPPKGLSRIIWYLPGMTVICKKEKLTSWAPTTSSMFMKKPLVDIGGFDKKLITAEDLEICWRLAKKEYKFKQIPQAQIIHFFRSSFSSFAKQQYERGYYGGFLLKKYGKGVLADFLNNIFLFLPLIVLLSFFFPKLLCLFLFIPLFFHFNLDRIEIFPRILFVYLKKEKDISGSIKLLILEYIRTFALLFGLFIFQIKNLF